MLCMRSASFTMMTRMSRTMAKQHLAKALGLRFLAILELDLIELADAVDEIGDHLPEYRDDLGLGGRRVLDHVMQDRRDESVGVELQIGEDVGDRDG